MPVDDLYWNSIDFGSEEDEEDHEILPSSSTPSPLTTRIKTMKTYIDPWDLENYAYIKEHLDSMDLNSDPNSIEFQTTEANSASFYYVPGDQQIKESANYVAIDEIRGYQRYDDDNGGSSRYSDREIKDLDESRYRDLIINNSYNWRKPPIDYRNNNNNNNNNKSRDRSLSFSYGDDYGFLQHEPKHEIYSKLDDFGNDSILYDDLRNNNQRKPRNFGLSNYGHLKIDYSYSWNNLNKYICS